MNKALKTFLRVLHSYSIEERVISILVLAVVLFLVLQSGVSVFKVPSFFTNQNSTYHEGLVTDRAIIINPLFTDFNEANREISSLIFSGLTKYDPQKKTFVPDLADFKISDDRKTYDFTLKPNLLWHDGQPLTVDDVYFTFHDLIQNPGFQNPVLQTDFEGIEIKKVDSQTIEFVLQTPNSFFITNTNIGIVPQHLLATVPIEQLPNNNFNVKPVGSGPYKIEGSVENFELGNQIVNVKAFDEYYGEKPKIQQLHFHLYPEFTDLKKELANLDIVPKVPAAEVAQLQSASGFQVLNYELPQYTAIFLNLNRPIFDKDKVRIALQKVIDTQQLLKLLNDKLAVNTPLLDLNQSEWIYKTNLQEAQGALFDSGYKLDKAKNDGYRYDTDGKILELTLLSRAYDDGTPQAEESKKVTDFLIEQWKTAGIKINLEAVDNDTFMQKLLAREYDLILAGQSLGYNLDTYAYWHSTQAGEGGLNLSNYKSFAADQLIEKIRDTFDATEKEKRLKDLAKVIADDIPAIFLYRPRYTLATNGKMKGMTLENLAFISDRFANINQWCVSCN